MPALARLVEHLVLQTVFHFEKVSDDAPFWFPMQVVDMIGSYFFLSASRLEAIAGLFAEMRVQRPGSIPVLPFLTSLEERFEKLVADPGARTGGPRDLRAERLRADCASRSSPSRTGSGG